MVDLQDRKNVGFPMTGCSTGCIVLHPIVGVVNTLTIVL